MRTGRKPTLAALLLACSLSGTGAAGPLARAPAPVPPLAAPVAPAPVAFPLQTAAQFFSGAARIVDLGGEPLGRWSIELAQAHPRARVELVNLKPVDSRILADQQRLHGVPNLGYSSYDFFQPPPGHPTGDRVVMNSPDFGGLGSAAAAARLAETIDRHLEPGGLFFGHGDDLWLMSLAEMTNATHNAFAAAQFAAMAPPGYRFVGLSERLENRAAAMKEALERRFGRENVASARLEGYARSLLNGGERYTVQVRKPL